mmetsp:Transcript_128323/g.369541  ORF Transcript_128323/g.369541 Transcript_128323/m.369541 type:complete len:200 (-) Transcript_128323:314-913(-)
MVRQGAQGLDFAALASGAAGREGRRTRRPRAQAEARGAAERAAALEGVRAPAEAPRAGRRGRPLPSGRVMPLAAEARSAPLPAAPRRDTAPGMPSPACPAVALAPACRMLPQSAAGGAPKEPTTAKGTHCRSLWRPSCCQLPVPHPPSVAVALRRRQGLDGGWRRGAATAMTLAAELARRAVTAFERWRPFQWRRMDSR